MITHPLMNIVPFNQDTPTAEAINSNLLDALSAQKQQFELVLDQIIQESPEIVQPELSSEISEAEPNTSEAIEVPPMDIEIDQEISLEEIKEIESPVISWINFVDPPIEEVKPQVISQESTIPSEIKNRFNPLASNNVEELPEVQEQKTPSMAIKLPMLTPINQEEATAESPNELNNSNINATIALKEINKSNLIFDEKPLIQESEPTYVLNPSIKMNTSASMVVKELEIAIPMRQVTEWKENFNQQIVWLGQQSIKSAIIKLNPQSLGPLEVSIQMDKDQANLHILSVSKDASEIIELALPELREKMAIEGLNLSNVEIKTRHESTNDMHAKKQFWNTDTNEEAKEQDSKPLMEVKTKLGLVDYFA